MNRIVRHIKGFFNDPEYRICKLLLHLIKLEQIPDRLFLKYQYHYVFGKRLDLKHPKTYNEKLQWLKLYDRRSYYTTLVDKYAVKEWVADKIGAQYIIPTLSVYDNTSQINLKDLPDQFVLKCTHDSGSVVICRDKTSFDWDSGKCCLDAGLHNDFYKKHREWPYKNVPHRIIAEQYIKDIESEDLRDYKLYCMDGECRVVLVVSNRYRKPGPYYDYFDQEFNHLDIKRSHPNNPHLVEKPQSFDRMKKMASILSQGIPHVRCDFYEANGYLYFGEMTFFPAGGIVPFSPSSVDEEWGHWIRLPHKTR